MDLKQENTQGSMKSVSMTQNSVQGKNKNIGVYMHVIIGKTVEAFKVNSGIYMCQGKAGAAILGNQDQSRYDLYIYREDQQKITSARIASRFQFEIHAHYYCSFYDNAGVSWAIRFDHESDSAEFIREVALARWKSGRSNGRILVQELRHGDSSNAARPNHVISVCYIAAVLNADNKFSPNIDGRVTRRVERVASSLLWETVLTNCHLNSSRIVIVPAGHQLQGPWMDLIDIENGDHLWLQMDVENILPDGQSSLGHESKEFLSRQSEEVKISSKKNEIASRLMKMGGQALVPFPTFPSEPFEPQEHQTNQEELDVSKSFECVKKRASAPPVLPPVVGNHRSSSSINEIAYPSVIQQLPPIQGETIDGTLVARKEAELNMLISEVRTTNSHLCMSMMRMSDKMDNILGRHDSSRSDSVLELKHWIANNTDLKIDLESKLKVLSDHNQAIIDMLGHQEKSKTEILKRVETMQDDMMNTILSVVPKGDQKTAEKGNEVSQQCSNDSCKSAVQIPLLLRQIWAASENESCLKKELSKCKEQIEKLQSELIMAKDELADALEEVIVRTGESDGIMDLLRMKWNLLESETKLLAPKDAISQEPKSLSKEKEGLADEQTSMKLAMAEKTVEKLNQQIKKLEAERCSEKRTKDHFPAEQLSAAVKTVMNLAWHALRSVLPQDNEQLQAQVVFALKGVAKEFLEQHGTQNPRPSTQSVIEKQCGRFSPSSSLPAIGNFPEDKHVNYTNEPRSTRLNMSENDSMDSGVKVTTIQKEKVFVRPDQDPKNVITGSQKEESSSTVHTEVSQTLLDDRSCLHTTGLDKVEKVSNDVKSLCKEDAEGISNHLVEVSAKNGNKDLPRGDSSSSNLEDVSKCERSLMLIGDTVVNKKTESATILSPGDGLMERRHTDTGLTDTVMSPGDGLTERPSTPALLTTRNNLVDTLFVSEGRSIVQDNLSETSGSLNNFSQGPTHCHNSDQNSSSGIPILIEEKLGQPSESEDIQRICSDDSGLPEKSLENESITNSTIGNTVGISEACNYHSDYEELPDPVSTVISADEFQVDQRIFFSHSSIDLSDSNSNGNAKSTVKPSDDSADEILTFTVHDEEWSDDGEDAETWRCNSDSTFESPPYAPLVSSEPPPLISSSPATPSSSPSPKALSHLSSATDDDAFLAVKSEKSSSSAQMMPVKLNPVWGVKPPPLLADDDEDAWLFQ